MKRLSFAKQPDEKVPITLDFKYALPSGEALVEESSEVIALDEAGVDVSSDLLDDFSVVSPQVTVTLMPRTGDPAKNDVGTYTLQFLVQTTHGYIIEQDVELTIVEI